MLKFVLGICMIIIVPLFLGTFWMHRIRHKDAATALPDEIVMTGAILMLALYTLADRIAHHSAGLSAHISAMTEILTAVCLILFGLFELRFFIGALKNIGGNLKHANRHVTIALTVLAVLAIVLALLVNPARYMDEAGAIVNGAVTLPRALDDFYLVLSVLLGPVLGSAHPKLLHYGMQLYWMVVTACSWNVIGRRLFSEERDRALFLWIAAGIFLLPVFSDSMDSLGFYTNLWRKETLLTVWLVPVFFMVMVQLFRNIRTENSTGTYHTLYKLAFVTAAGFACARIALAYGALTVFVAWLAGRFLVCRDRWKCARNESPSQSDDKMESGCKDNKTIEISGTAKQTEAAAL